MCSCVRRSNAAVERGGSRVRPRARPCASFAFPRPARPLKRPFAFFGGDHGNATSLAPLGGALARSRGGRRRRHRRRGGADGARAAVVGRDDGRGALAHLAVRRRDHHGAVHRAARAAQRVRPDHRGGGAGDALRARHQLRHRAGSRRRRLPLRRRHQGLAAGDRRDLRRGAVPVQLLRTDRGLPLVRRDARLGHLRRPPDLRHHRRRALRHAAPVPPAPRRRRRKPPPRRAVGGPAPTVNRGNLPWVSPSRCC